uniref:RxLR effector protein n=1 Tax=Phytophthora agathidicida TaxID=1642459 RepID=A0A7G4WI09_9STRA|nr:PaRXLR20 [Phytophthora agathidicida]
MRLCCFLAVSVATFLSSCITFSEATPNALQRSNAAVGDISDKRHLRSRKTTDENEDEERAFDAKRLWDWKYFTKASLFKMLRDEQYMFKMFKKWDEYNVDQLTRRIGESTLSDKRLAAMFVKYIENARTYKWHNDDKRLPSFNFDL